MQVLNWLWSKSSAEKLLAKALLHFEQGDPKDALANLLDGLIGLAGTGKAGVELTKIKAEAVQFGMIPAPVVVATVAAPVLAPPILPVVDPAPAAPV